MSGYRPGDSVVRDGIGAVFAVFAVVFVIGVIVVVGWQVGWWFNTENTNRQAQLDRNGYGFQKPLQDQISDEIGQVLQLNRSLAGEMNNPNLVGPDSATRKDIVVNICRQATEVNPAVPLQGDQAAFVGQNCFAGTIAPGSPYN
jgi:hypothetical protein